MKQRIGVLLAVFLLALTAVVLRGTGGDLRATVQDGLTAISGVDLPQGDPRTEVADAIRLVVTYVALAAVVAIVAAGIVFMVGAGSETAVQRGRKIILYTIIGLLIIFFARVIVAFFTQELPT